MSDLDTQKEKSARLAAQLCDMEALAQQYMRQWERATGERDEARAEVTHLWNERTELTERLRVGVLDLHVARTEATELRAEVERSREVIRELRVKLAEAGVEGSPPPGETTIGQLQRQRDEARAARENLHTLVEQMRKAQENWMDRAVKAEAEVEQLNAVFEQRARWHAEARASVAELSAEVERLKLERAEVVGESCALAAEVRRLHEALSVAALFEDDLRQTIARLRGEVADLVGAVNR